MKNSTNKLETICNKYRNIQQNDDNYSIGGGLDGSKFASRRHEDAKYDEGKLTLGEATQLFKKATGLEIDTLREVIKYAVPNMEWHHAGKLPKSYGGGMKKTYFLNAAEICECAKNWDANIDKLNLSKISAKNGKIVCVVFCFVCNAILFISLILRPKRLSLLLILLLSQVSD